MISVLMPSRARAALAAKSIESLVLNAGDPGAFEVIIAVDPDEPQLQEYSRLSQRRPDVWLWEAPERYGYRQLHRYYNDVLRLAHGKWLMLWNDDATMVTPGWDDVIHTQRPAVLWPLANHSQDGCLFPIWPKHWSDVCGHTALAANIDVWWQEIGTALGRLDRIPVEIHHDRHDVTGANDDQTYREGSAAAGPNINYPDYETTAGQRDRDTETIRRLL